MLENQHDTLKTFINKQYRHIAMPAKDKTISILKHVIPACFVFAVIVFAVTFDQDIMGIAFGISLLIALIVSGVYYLVVRAKEGR
jgi:hypothetical protein